MEYLPKNFNSPIHRVAILGGSFDPPTLGHQNVIEQLMTTMPSLTEGVIDEMLLIPSASHAFGKNLTPLPVRIGLLERFLADLVDIHPGLQSKIRILNIEPDLLALHSTGYVYTYDVLEKVEALYTAILHELYFVIGPDLARPEVFSRFYRAEELKKKWKIIAVEQLRSVRSTEVRHKIAASGLSYLISPHPDLSSGVVAEIIRYKLYGLEAASIQSQINIKMDMLIFSIQQNDLYLCINQNADNQLPYAFIDPNIDKALEPALNRSILNQLGDLPKYHEQVITQGVKEAADWCVSITYFCLTNKIKLENVENVWVKASDFLKKNLSNDQKNSLILSVERLKNKASYTSIPCYLAAELFTLSELQKIYEIVLGFKLEKKSFRRRLIESGLLEEIGKTRKANHRPAQLYKLSHKASSLYYFTRIIEGSRGH